MAQWYTKGKLNKGDDFIHESIIGSKFIGRIEEELSLAGRPAIRPSVEGGPKFMVTIPFGLIKKMILMRMGSRFFS